MLNLDVTDLFVSGKSNCRIFLARGPMWFKDACDSQGIPMWHLEDQDPDGARQELDNKETVIWTIGSLSFGKVISRASVHIGKCDSLRGWTR